MISAKNQFYWLIFIGNPSSVNALGISDLSEGKDY